MSGEAFKGEFNPKKIIASNEHLCLIKSHILHESDNLCRIYTMFEDLFLAFYLLITILQRFFLRMLLHILWWACECLLNANIGLYAPVFYRIRALFDNCAVRNAFYFFCFKLQTLKRFKFVTDAYLHVVCCDLETKNM